MEETTVQPAAAEQPAIQFSLSKTTVFNLCAIATMVAIQFIWLAATFSTKIAAVNLLPATVLITVWTLFVTQRHANNPSTRNWLLLPVLLLNMRLPVTIAQGFELLNWALCLIMAITVIRRIYEALDGKTERVFLIIAAVLVLFQTATHLGMDSPYTYTFRLVFDVPPGYTGVDNNQTWECPYEAPEYVVHCDTRHFVASEKIFTEPNYDPSFSVILQRFLHGYFNSLAGLEGTRFWVNICVNALFWFFACAAIFRVAKLLKQNNVVAGFAMLFVATGVGFVDMVGQPMPYHLAFAYGPIALWGTMELIYGELTRRRAALMIIIIASVLMIYDAFQLIFALCLVLFLHKKRYTAGIIFGLAVLFTTTWRQFSMKMVLGTQGDLTSYAATSQLLKLDFNTWFGVIKAFDITAALHMSNLGVQSYLYGNLIIGALAAWAYVAGVGRIKPATAETRTFLMALIAIHVLVLLSTLFVVPQMMSISGKTGMQPRLSFYSYPISMIALAIISVKYLKQYAWVVLVLLFVMANINLTGLATIDLLFDYGRIGIFWK